MAPIVNGKRAVPGKRSRGSFMSLRLSLIAFYFIFFLGYAAYQSFHDDKDFKGVGRKLLSAGGGGCDTKSPFYGGVAGEANAEWATFIGEIICVLYCFVGLAIICDEFFVSALEAISDKLKLSPEVAGATFMAAGSSAPELFTSLAAVIIGGLSAEDGGNSTGIGTIVGSSIFNYTIVIGITILAAPTKLNLKWLPLVRDTVFYLAITIQLVIYFQYWTPGFISLTEACIMFLFYWLYLLYMKFDKKISIALKQYDEEVEEGALEVDKKKENKDVEMGAVGSNSVVPTPSNGKPEAENVKESPKQAFIDKTAGRNDSEGKKEDGQEETRHHHHGSRRSSAASSVAEELRTHYGVNPLHHPKFRVATHYTITETQPFDKKMSVDDIYLFSKVKMMAQKWKLKTEESKKKMVDEKKSKEEDEPDSIYRWPKKARHRISYILTFPLLFLFHYTVPDCRKEKFARFFPATFLLSIVWIAALSYVMVESATYIGCFLRIPAIIMGLTVLAAGTSVPDSLSSIVVARSGLASMAVANSLGSNVFDGVVGLPLPWIIGIVAFQRAIEVSALGLWIYILIDFGILFSLLFMCAVTKFRPGKGVGALLFVLYGLWTVFGILTGIPEGAPVICLGTRNETSGACIDPTLDFYANTSLVNMTAINEQGSNKTLQGELAHLFIFY
mmetsp:Transcript_34095/g.87942  ORF Transcript_34095/g.87942 Transcript_34095/m.87942 type:complete len:673 (-) Transcript_34095:1763-3781(-)